MNSNKTKTGINPIDKEFLMLIINGYTSAYAIWSHIKEEAKVKGSDNINLKVTSYNNVNKRITNLIDDGILEEMKTDTSSLHGRKDIKLTTKGLEYLMPYIMDHPNEHVKTIVEYIEMFIMDKMVFEKLLTDRIQYSFDFINFFLRTIKNNPELSAAYSTKAANQLQKVHKEMTALLEIEKLRITLSLSQQSQQSQQPPTLSPTLKSRAKSRFGDDTLIGIGEDGMFTIADREETEYNIEEKERLQKARDDLEKRQLDKDVTPKATTNKSRIKKKN